MTGRNPNDIFVAPHAYLTSKAVCRVFGISESSLRDYEKRGNLKTIELDGLKRYSVKEVDIIARSLRQKRKIKTILPDWFYWAYESPLGKKIDTLDKYFSEFPFMRDVFKQIEEHPHSNTTFGEYAFCGIRRADSPLSHHVVHFERPASRLEIEVIFEMMPSGDEYLRTEPTFIREEAAR